MIYGYLKKFDYDQTFAHDYRILSSAGISQILLDEPNSDKSIQKIFANANLGDKIVTTSPARLASSASQLHEILTAAQQKRMRLHIGQNFTFNFAADTKYNPSIVLMVSALYSELESDLCGTEGSSAPKIRIVPTVRVGRPRTRVEDIPQIFLKYYSAHQNGSINISEFSRLSRLSRPTIYKYLKIMENISKKE